VCNCSQDVLIVFLRWCQFPLLTLFYARGLQIVVLNVIFSQPSGFPLSFKKKRSDSLTILEFSSIRVKRVLPYKVGTATCNEAWGHYNDS
jgi:hypothetical protein